MSELNYPESKLWWIATFEGGVHYGVLEPEQCLAYGDKTLTTYDNEADWVEALEALGVVFEEEITEQEGLTE